MRTVLFLSLPLLVFAKNSFITPMEYATSLYKNPRGIGCDKCHGEAGEGRIVAKYEHKKQKKNFEAPAIYGLEFGAFYRALNKRTSGMPRYFLTDQEIKALYFYLQEKNKETKTDAK